MYNVATFFLRWIQRWRKKIMEFRIPSRNVSEILFKVISVVAQTRNKHWWRLWKELTQPEQKMRDREKDSTNQKSVTQHSPWTKAAGTSRMACKKAGMAKNLGEINCAKLQLVPEEGKACWKHRHTGTGATPDLSAMRSFISLPLSLSLLSLSLSLS